MSEPSFGGMLQKLVDGTRIRLMFDDDDWYSGKVIGYDAGTARYRVVFEDGEEAECRHALFEPGGTGPSGVRRSPASSPRRAPS